MGGQDSSPAEPSKVHSHSVGRGGIGNFCEVKQSDKTTPEPLPPKAGPVAQPEHVNQPHSTGRGGTGNIKVVPNQTSNERENRLSTTAKKPEVNFGRGGFGNIEAARALTKKKEEEKEQRNALMAEMARAKALAAVEAIQVPKPIRTV